MDEERLDKELRSLGHAVHREVEASVEVDAAWAVREGRVVPSVASAAQSNRQRMAMSFGLAAAAVAALVVTGIVLLNARDDTTELSTDTVPPVTTSESDAAPATTTPAATDQPVVTAPPSSLPVAAPGDPIGVSFDAPPPELPLTAFGSIDLGVEIDPQMTLVTPLVGSSGVSLKHPESSTVYVVEWKGAVRQIDIVGIEDHWRPLAFGPGDVLYGHRTITDPPYGRADPVAIALSGPSEGHVVWTGEPIDINPWLESPRDSFGHDEVGVVARVREPGTRLHPRVGTSGELIEAPIEAAPMATMSGSTVTTGTTTWELDIERAPGFTEPFVWPGFVPSPTTGDRYVYANALSTAPDSVDFGVLTDLVIAVLEPDGTGSWYSIPDGWEYGASDVWGTVFYRLDGTRLELALLDDALPPADTDTGAPTPTTPAPTTTVSPQQLSSILPRYESARIPFSCDPLPGDGAFTRCTQVVIDPTGVPVSYDPGTRTLTRHTREDGEYATLQLDESYGDSLYVVAAGPDGVVYLNVITEAGGEGSADLVAIALAAGDTGRELERAIGVGNPGRDSDLVVVPEGITSTGWYGPEPRPSGENPLHMAWVDRGTSGAAPNSVRDITVSAGGVVTVDGRSWQLSGHTVDYPPTGMPQIVGTFDGGFIAHYSEFISPEARATVVRGWPDGSVEEWVVPADELVAGESPADRPRIVPEPMGTVLISAEDRYVRYAPFEHRPTGWTGRLSVDRETYGVDVTEINDYLSSLNWGSDQPPWNTDAIAFANAVAGSSVPIEELRTIEVVARTTDAAVIAVTTENHFDDSSYASRWVITIDEQARRVESIEWSQTCQPDRGHQDYAAATCI